MSTISRMRTIRQCYEEIKLGDPESGISEHYLRQLVKRGEIPVFKAGVKFLINWDKLMEYLNTPVTQEVNTNESQKLRKVK